MRRNYETRRAARFRGSKTPSGEQCETSYIPRDTRHLNGSFLQCATGAVATKTSPTFSNLLDTEATPSFLTTLADLARLRRNLEEGLTREEP